MKPSAQLIRKIQERTLKAIHLLEECERLVEPEIRIGMSTYKLDRKHATELYACIEETLTCLKKMLVSL